MYYEDAVLSIDASHTLLSLHVCDILLCSVLYMKILLWNLEQLQLENMKNEDWQNIVHTFVPKWDLNYKEHQPAC
jgi:hypothetical protein